MSTMQESIFKSIKKMVGFESDYDVFDVDLYTHINSAISTLTQLGVGPKEGFVVTDSELPWSTFISTNTNLLHMVKSYVYLRVRLLLDPPSTSFGISAMQEQIKELEWRINVAAEEVVI